MKYQIFSHKENKRIPANISDRAPLLDGADPLLHALLGNDLGNHQPGHLKAERLCFLPFNF